MKNPAFSHRTIPVLLFAFITVVSFSCKKDTGKPESATRSFLSLKIDAQFNLENYVDVPVTLTLNDPEGQKWSAFIYDENPGTTGKLLASGSFDGSGNFSATLRLPVTLKKVTLRITTGSYSEYAEVSVVNRQIVYSFHDPSGGLKETSYDCTSGCHHTISGTQTDVVIQNGETTCLTGTLNGTVHFIGGGTLRVCGTANITNVTANPGSIGNIWITNTGTFNCPGFIQLPNSINFVNYGVATFTSYLQNTSGCFFQNYGTFQAQSLVFNAGAKCINNPGGIINLTQDLTTSSWDYEMHNKGTMHIGGTFTNNGYFQNMCRIEVDGDLNNLSSIDFKGGSSLEVGGTYLMEQSTTNYIIPDGSIYIRAHNLMVKGIFWDLCYAPYYHRIDVTHVTSILSTATVSGNLDICDANGIETNEISLPPSITYCVHNVAPSPPCIPDPAPPPPPDADGDGVPDVSDAYPTDPTRAYNSFYPDETGFVNFAFEDLWPGKGDYDFNDVVMAANYKIVTNASNKVVDLIARFKLRAFGAFLDNGFGFCLSAPPSAVATVTGSQLNGVVTLDPKGFEAGHSSQTVIILYDAINTHFNGSIENTIPGKPQVATPEETITVHFSTPQTSIGTLPYNPFIFIDRDRGKEVHFPDKEPTELVNPGYFGMFEDDSDPLTGRYYKTALNHPWAIETPEVFDYPIEKSDITAAYMHFAAWAESSGTLYPGWFEDLPGYRNAPLIY